MSAGACGTVVLGLGTNLGDRAIWLKRAVNRLARGPGAPLAEARVSAVYASDAWVPDGAPESWRRPFLNCAVAGRTGLDPDTLLARLHEIERELGRRPSERWAPRVIDIDILWWDGVRVSGPNLEIPHPGLLERPFAIEPMADLVPEVTLEGRTVREHGDRLRKTPPVQGGARWAPDSEFRVRWPRLMGILNVTPDSFSDGGLLDTLDAALGHAHRLLDGGAEYLDLGAESTRPDGVPVSDARERERLEPVLARLAQLRAERPFRLSLDSRNPETVAWGLDQGVDVINDVTGFGDPRMVELAARSDAEAVCMHALSVPVVKGEFLPDDCDPVSWLTRWGARRLETLLAAGLPRSRTYFDPGIGFGKTTAQNWRILREIDGLHALGVPLLVGHSRKSFFRRITDRPADQRDDATVEVSLQLARSGVEVLRVHDPAAHTARFRAQHEASAYRPEAVHLK